MTRLRAAKPVRFVRHRLRLTNQQRHLDKALEPSNSFHTSWQRFCTWLRACPAVCSAEKWKWPSRRQARGEQPKPNPFQTSVFFFLSDRGPWPHEGKITSPNAVAAATIGRNRCRRHATFVVRPSPRVRTSHATQTCCYKWLPALLSASMGLAGA